MKQRKVQYKGMVGLFWMLQKIKHNCWFSTVNAVNFCFWKNKAAPVSDVNILVLSQSYSYSNVHTNSLYASRDMPVIRIGKLDSFQCSSQRLFLWLVGGVGTASVGWMPSFYPLIHTYLKESHFWVHKLIGVLNLKLQLSCKRIFLNLFCFVSL